jgi:hypothetical protein
MASSLSLFPELTLTVTAITFNLSSSDIIPRTAHPFFFAQCHIGVTYPHTSFTAGQVVY